MASQNLENSWRKYQIVNEWIRYADSKAEVVLGFVGIITGFILSSLARFTEFFVGEHMLIFIFLLIGIVCAICTVFFAIRCLNPILKVGELNSLIYFGHIAKNYESFELYRRDLANKFLTEEQVTIEVESQIWANSKIALKKFKAVSIAIWFLSLTIFFSIISIIFLALF